MAFMKESVSFSRAEVLVSPEVFCTRNEANESDNLLLPTMHQV